MAVFYLIIAIVLFIGLVLIHEWGHFVAARRGGVEVEEYGIGFPPRVWGKKIKTKNSEFLFSVNLLPLGGFVKLKGENDADKRPGTFGAAPLSTKVKIMMAGVFMNLVTALVLFTALAWIGMPKLVDNQFTVASDTKLVSEVKDQDVVRIAEVVANGPADRAGIKPGDQLVSLAGQEIKQTDKIGAVAKENAGKTVEAVLKRGGETVNSTVSLNAQNDGKGYLEIVSESGSSGYEVRRSTWSAPVVAVGLTAQFTELTFKGIGHALKSLAVGNPSEAAEQVAGPVGIAVILDKVSEIGLNFMLMVIAIISLTLAIMNVLPIPALDGGRLFVTLLYRALKRPLSKEAEERIHGTGFVCLMLLFVVITIVDINRFIL